MEPLSIPNKDRDYFLLRFIFYVVLLLFLLYVTYVSFQKESLTIEIVLIALIAIPTVLWALQKLFDQLRTYSPVDITLDERGVTFSSSFYVSTVFVPWEMIRGLTTHTVRVKWASITYLKIVLADPEAFYAQANVRPLFGDRTSYHASLQDVNATPAEIMESIMNYRNTLEK